MNKFVKYIFHQFVPIAKLGEETKMFHDDEPSTKPKLSPQVINLLLRHIRTPATVIAMQESRKRREKKYCQNNS